MNAMSSIVGAGGSRRRTFLKGIGAAGLAGLAGCTDRGGGGPDSVKLGLQADLTGALSFDGYWYNRLLNSYVDVLNDNGGINGATVELAVEDTGTAPDQGQQALRALLLQENCDFIVGSQSSAVNIASMPLIKEEDVPYMALGEAMSLNRGAGNRWMIRPRPDLVQKTIVGVDWGLQNLGSRWTVLYQDYAYGQQSNEALVAEMERRGEGEVLQSIAVPLGTSDLSSHLNQVPAETEVLFHVLVGPSVVGYLQQTDSREMDVERFGATMQGIDLNEVPAAGSRAIRAYPGRSMESGEVAGLSREAYQNLIELMRVEESDRALRMDLHFSAFEAVNWIKMAAEAINWSSAEDNQSFIEWFEAEQRSVEGGMDFPQGPKFIRPADHQAFTDVYIERIIEDNTATVDAVYDNGAQGIANYDVVTDISAEEF